MNKFDFEEANRILNALVMVDPFYMEKERTVFKMCCFYNAKTELYDRTLTDKRSKYDHTAASLEERMTYRLSNGYAVELMERLVLFANDELGIHADDFRNMFKRQNMCNYSAQGWIDLYNQLKENGEMEFLNGF